MRIEFSGNNHDHLIAVNKLLWKKTAKPSWQYVIVMTTMGTCMLSIVLVESGRQSFWNGLTCVGLALLGITGLIIRQLYVSKKRYFERVQKYIAHKNSLGKDWKVLIADDHLAASDANRKM